MFNLLIIFVIAIVGLFIYQRFSTYKTNRLLMYSMKMSHMYVHEYNSYVNEDSNISKQDLYIKILESKVTDQDNKENGALQILTLVRNQLQPGDEIKFRDIVKFLIIGKIYGTSELSGLLENDDKSMELYLKCSLLPETEKTKTGDILRKNGYTPEQQNTFAKNLSSLERAVDTAVPAEY